MTKRYRIDTPAVRKRRENAARQKAAEYQSRLMPDPGTPAWSQGLETSTPFFDIATVGVGGGLNLLRKGIAQKLAAARARRKSPIWIEDRYGRLTRNRDPVPFTSVDREKLMRKYQQGSTRDYPRESVVGRPVSDDMARWADDDAIPFAGTRTRAGGEYLPERIPRRRGYPNRAANIAEKKYERYVDEMVSGPTSEKQIRKIRAKIEMDRRGAANRRRRMQGSIADDIDIAEYGPWDFEGRY